MEKYRNSGGQPGQRPQPPTDRTAGKTALVLLAGTISALYLMLPLGALDITDYIPIIGNFDEATAVLVLIASLRYFGLDITKWINFAKKHVPDDPGQATGGRRQEKVVSPHDPEVEAARETMYTRR
jgi:hypothetical protein